ncbi:MAG: hypothetical protein ACXWDO_10975 [Bacteroidia bacterium]
MESKELIEALKMKIEALEMKNEALGMKIEALVMKNDSLQLLRSAEAEARQLNVSDNAEEENGEEQETNGKKRGRKPKATNNTARLQVPLEAEIRNMLSGERFNRATYRAITGILLCLYENGKANVNGLFDYVGGSRVTIVRHTALMKKLDMLRYEGSRKKGYYVLTDNGKAIVERIASAA